MYSGYQELLVKKIGKVVLVQFNRPIKKNSLNRLAYEELTRVLMVSDESINIIVLTGTGDYFSSGHDISLLPNFDDFEEYLKNSEKTILGLIRAVINSTKILIAIVNGPCIGIGATLAALCDLIYCSETAYFQTPFSKLGLCPEGCSSFIFPHLLGHSKATEMLAFNEKLTAAEALEYKLVSRIFQPNELETVIWPKIFEYSRLPAGSLKSFKILVRKTNREDLENACKAECDELMERWHSEEVYAAISAFNTRKTSKL